ncbi:MAG TPA: hypothetical protein EYP98_00545 [Planctomycetes bacterium]|nr:hypothetical protein [Planctomycetota bacterium]
MNGIAKDYEGKMKFVVEDGNTDASKARIEEYGLEIHGMVITDDKDDSVVWSESGHNQKKAVVKAAIDKTLSS